MLVFLFSILIPTSSSALTIEDKYITVAYIGAGVSTGTIWCISLCALLGEIDKKLSKKGVFSDDSKAFRRFIRVTSSALSGLAVGVLTSLIVRSLIIPYSDKHPINEFKRFLEEVEEDPFNVSDRDRECIRRNSFSDKGVIRDFLLKNRYGRNALYPIVNIVSVANNMNDVVSALEDTVVVLKNEYKKEDFSDVDQRVRKLRTWVDYVRNNFINRRDNRESLDRESDIRTRACVFEGAALDLFENRFGEDDGLFRSISDVESRINHLKELVRKN